MAPSTNLLLPWPKILVAQMEMVAQMEIAFLTNSPMCVSIGNNLSKSVGVELTLTSDFLVLMLFTEPYQENWVLFREFGRFFFQFGG